MTYASDAEEREERTALKRELFAADLAKVAAAAKIFDEMATALFNRAEPQDRARLAAIISRYETYIVAEELGEWAGDFE